MGHRTNIRRSVGTGQSAHLRAFAVALALAAAGAVPATLSPAVAHGAEPELMLTTIQTPSGNITCMLGTFPAGTADTSNAQFVRCDVGRTRTVLPKRPADCELDWGTVITLSARSKATFGACVGDAVGPGRVLAYGKSIRRGPFYCTSRTTGLTCTSTSRHGFSASREAVRTY